MRKTCRCLFLCMALVFFAWFGTVLADRQKLREDLIRIHVVANSDSPEDQAIKLSVRDAVISSLQEELKNVSDPEMARIYLQENLPRIQAYANQTLAALGCSDTVTATLQEEDFERSENAVFSLPAGVYESLRLTIGAGEGRNWWTVIFPDAVFSNDKDSAVISVFSASTEKVEQTDDLKIRFWFLDVLGKLENNLFQG